MKMKGFTLIETVMIIVLLGIVGAGTLMYFAGMRGSADPVLRLQAIELAQERMEKIIADKKANVNGSYPGETPISGFSNFSRSVEICDVDETNFTTCTTAVVTAMNWGVWSGSAWKKIKVIVSWTGGGSISLVTVVSDH